MTPARLVRARMKEILTIPWAFRTAPGTAQRVPSCRPRPRGIRPAGRLNAFNGGDGWETAGGRRRCQPSPFPAACGLARPGSSQSAGRCRSGWRTATGSGLGLAIGREKGWFPLGLARFAGYATACFGRMLIEGKGTQGGAETVHALGGVHGSVEGFDHASADPRRPDMRVRSGGGWAGKHAIVGCPAATAHPPRGPLRQSGSSGPGTSVRETGKWIWGLRVVAKERRFCC